MPRSWPQIVIALEQVAASAAVVRPGLYRRVLQRLFTEGLLPAGHVMVMPNDDVERGHAAPPAAAPEDALP